MTMPRLLLLSLALASSALAGPHGPGPASARAPWRAVDRVCSDYREDGGTKIVAAMETVLERRGRDARVRVVVRAHGLRVQGEAGARGVHGHNRHTASELSDMLIAGELAVVGRSVDGAPNRWRTGSVEVLVRDTVPVRRLWAGGRIDHLARTAAAYPVELEFVLGGIPAAGPSGSHFLVQLMARGVPRWHVAVDGTATRVERVAGLDRFGLDRTGDDPRGAGLQPALRGN